MPIQPKGGALLGHLAEVEGIEVVGIARNRRAATRLAQVTQFEVFLVDLMLPSFRSIDVIG